MKFLGAKPLSLCTCLHGTVKSGELSYILYEAEFSAQIKYDIRYDEWSCVKLKTAQWVQQFSIL